ncbi:L-amino-acid oxidase isoform X2 [Denticeps clupeoides]|nr:L-amino-acid oxidase isoform X2 [Denticeps clupeoides]
MPHRWTLCRYVPVAVVLVIVYTASGTEEDPIQKCLADPDYDTLYSIMTKGLPVAKTSLDVVIVGGGVAGLIGAKYLEDAGHKVTIIEASNRLGGRVQTYYNEKEGWYAELGAMRIPEVHKILINFLSTLNLKLTQFIQDDPSTFYYVNGNLGRSGVIERKPDLLKYNVTPSERGKTAAQLFDKALEPIRSNIRSIGCNATMTKYDSYSVKEYLVNVAKLSHGAIRMIGDVLNENSFFYTGLTEMLFIQSDIRDNMMYFEIAGGMESLIKAIDKTLNCTILLESKVKQISQTGGKVKVKFQQPGRPSTLKSISADYVLVTATAKATQLIEFNPPLSTLKMEALRSVHYSSSTKVVLSFSKRFWELDGIQGGKSITDRPSRFIYYPSHKFPGDGGALLASYTCSDDSMLFQGLSDQELMEVVLNDLVKMHGDEIRSLCTGVVVKKWSNDPYSLGAFAIFTPFQRTEYAAALSQSEGRIHFAGEHTATPHAWIETAMKSAFRAIQNINDQTS